MLPVFIIISLIFLTGFFVAAEFSIVSASRTVIEKKAQMTQPLAKLVHKIHMGPGQIEQYIASAQVGITLASLALGMYGEHMLATWVGNKLEGFDFIPLWISVHTLASILAVGFLTYFHIILGEMVPKSLALQKPETIVLFVTPGIIIVKYIFYPLIMLMNSLGFLFLRLMGLDRHVGGGHSHYHTPEELEYIVKESQEGGLLGEESGEMLKELFDFEDLTAGEVMSPRVKITGIPCGITKEELHKILSSSLHTRYPLYEENLDNILGTIHLKELLKELVNEAPLNLEKYRSVPFVPSTASLNKVLEAMSNNKTQMAVVMDEYGGTAGLITIEDIFEEVTGEIDEDTSADKNIFRDQEGRLHVAGTVRIDEVGEVLGIKLEHEEVDTVSGLVLDLLGRPPKVGDVGLYKGLRFIVTAVEGHGVKECIIKFIKTAYLTVKDIKK